MENNEKTTWWGQFGIQLNHPAQWRIGPLSLSVLHLEKEWQIAYKVHEEPEWDISQWSFNPDGIFIEDAETKRFVFTATAEQLTITPLLADRSVVTRPETPFHVPAGQEANLFVSTPLWLRLQVHEPPVRLLEMAIMRPSDTWFGPSTMEGELSYASQTLGRLSLDDFPHLPHRAITPVVIRNNTDTAFQLERLNLPVTYLSLYCSSEHYLWTESVTMIREPDTSAARIQIGEGVPEQVSDAVPISESRQKAETRSLISKVSALFG